MAGKIANVRTPIPMIAAGLAALALSACASFTPDGGMSPIAARTSLELGASVVKISSAADLKASRAHAAALLARPLTADAAAQIALLSNRGLQAAYNDLGISEADYVAATLPPITPSLAVERAFTEMEFSIERTLAASILQLVTYSKRRKIAETEFRAKQFAAIEATFRTAGEARRAFYRAVAARQRASFLQRAQTTAGIAAELTRKQGETGAQTKLVQARASVFYTEVSAELARARVEVDTSREELIRLLGVWGADTEFGLPGNLPRLPPVRTADEIEREALTRRVDLAAARLELEATARSLGLTDATKYISVLDVTGTGTTTWVKEEGKTEVDNSFGIDLELEIPIFDLGETKSRRARETYMQAANRLIELAVNIRSEARQAYRAYRGTYDIAVLYQNRIIPLRRSIDEQTLLEYNGMLVDVFDLLTTARESITSNISAIDAKLEFFIAEVEFQAALIGGGGAGGAGESSAEQSAEPEASGGH